ncbi:MAG: carbohydrate-binding family 9-like protein [Verrucomicrobiota bacterium]
MKKRAKNSARIEANSVYVLRKAKRAHDFTADWNSPSWKHAESLEIKHFRKESGRHRPRTFVRLLYDLDGIHGVFKVQDRFVRCTRTRYGDEVWKDSCVEFFFQPKSDKGYFNFEFNCGGAFLSCYITNPERIPGGFKDFTKIPFELGRRIRVRSSLAPVTTPEISEPIDWTLQFYIPFSLLEPFVGPLGKINEQECRGNFFKCAEENSHPHWASWSPVDEFNFHRPRCFGTIQFEK